MKRLLLLTTCVCFAGAVAPATPAWAQTQTVRITGPGGDYQTAQRKAWYGPAKTEANIEVKEDSGGELSVVRAQVRSGHVTSDLVSLGAQDCVIGDKEGLFEPLDYSIVSKDGYPAQYAQPTWIGIIYYSTVIVYNKKFAANPPKSWADFWDTKRFPGPRSLRNLPQLMIEAALLADGVTPDALYPLDLDRAFKSLARIKPAIDTWWTSGAQTAQLISSGEVDLIGMWNGRAQPAVAGGAPYAFSFDQALITPDCYAIPKGAPNRGAAMKMLAYMTRPDVAARISQYIPYGPVNEMAVAMIPAALRSTLNSAPDNLKLQVRSNEQWWVENGAKARERWDAFIAR